MSLKGCQCGNQRLHRQNDGCEQSTLNFLFNTAKCSAGKKIPFAEKSLLSGKTPEEAFIAAEEETGARKFARDEDDDEKEEE